MENTNVPSDNVPVSYSPLVKVVMVNTVSFPVIKHKSSLDIVESIRLLYKPNIEIDIGYSKEKQTELRGIPLSIQEIYRQLPKNKVVPPFHILTPFHYQKIYPRYSHRISYSDYLLLEEQLSNILLAYIDDTRNYRYLFVYKDPNWFHDESILSYTTHDQKRRVVRYYLKDIDLPFDQTYSSVDPIFSEFKLFLWHPFLHPYL
jgi:hypothetical protein